MRPIRARRTLLQLACLVTCGLPLATPAAAQVQWSGNGHYYQAVYTPNTITWSAAYAAATSMGGYLATLTSAGENAFAYALVSDPKFFYLDGANNSQGPWLGGYRAGGYYGSFVWATGEAFTYTNWGAGQPDNCCLGEDYLQFYGPNVNNQLNPEPTWNDAKNNYAVRGFVVEYDTFDAPVTAPEPSSLVLLGTALVGVVGAGRIRRRFAA